jgi:dipeptidyl aminopeptidase/acylaminoacyl peptidase
MKRKTFQFPALLSLSVAAIIISPGVLRAQEKPLLIINDDCKTFAIGPGNLIAYAVPKMKRIKKQVIERDEIWIAELDGKRRRIVDPDKFMPTPPPSTYIVNSLAWSPDGHKLAVSMTTMEAASILEDQPATGVKAVALLDDDGREIKVAGSKTRFIEGASNATWLADGETVVYMTPGSPYQISSVRPSDGKTKSLFEGHSFEAVSWDAKNNSAFVIGQNLSVRAREVLARLDLVRETVQEITKVDMYQGQLSISPSGNKVAFFVDGDAIQVVDVANPTKVIKIRAGMGHFEWSHDEMHVLLKRGPDEASRELVWVGLYDGTFAPALQGLEYHDFRVTPDGEYVAVTEPGSEIMKVYPAR